MWLCQAQHGPTFKRCCKAHDYQEKIKYVREELGSVLLSSGQLNIFGFHHTCERLIPQRTQWHWGYQRISVEESCCTPTPRGQEELVSFSSLQELPSSVFLSKYQQDFYIFFFSNLRTHFKQRENIRTYSVKDLAGFQSCLLHLGAKLPWILKGCGCPITPK